MSKCLPIVPPFIVLMMVFVGLLSLASMGTSTESTVFGIAFLLAILIDIVNSVGSGRTAKVLKKKWNRVKSFWQFRVLRLLVISVAAAIWFVPISYTHEEYVYSIELIGAADLWLNTDMELAIPIPVKEEFIEGTKVFEYMFSVLDESVEEDSLELQELKDNVDSIHEREAVLKGLIVTDLVLYVAIAILLWREEKKSNDNRVHTEQVDTQDVRGNYYPHS